MNKRLCKKYSIVSKVLYHCKITKCIFDCFYLFWCRMFPRLFQFFYRIRSIIHRQSQISLYLCDICGMYLEAVFRFYVLLNHFVGHFFFGLVRFGSFSNTIYRNLALALSKLHINVDITVGFFVGQKNYRLNELVPDLMKLMDEKKLGFTTAVELSYIGKKNQNYIAVAIDSQQSSPSQAQAKRMRELDEKKLLNGDVIDGIMMEDKKEVDKVILTGAELSKYFGKETTPREMKDQIIKLLDDWKGQQKEHEKPEKKTEQEK